MNVKTPYNTIYAGEEINIVIHLKLMKKILYFTATGQNLEIAIL